MAKKQYYAVKIGKIPGIYETWDECRLQVNGISGAVYKAFKTKDEAESFMGGNIVEDTSNEDVEKLNEEIEEMISSLGADEVVAFVDGTYKDKRSGFGAIIIDNNRNETPLYKAFYESLNPEFIELRNVAAELEGVKEAIKCAVSCKKKKITIYHDYEGIGKWADGSWQAKKEITQKYVSFLAEYKAYITISFVKVPAHSGVKYNEMVDQLAKNSLLEKGYKTYDDGSIYIVGFDKNDWKCMVELINSENRDFKEETPVSFTNQNIEGKRERIEITHKKNRVVINCYPGKKSFMQGKQSPIFQKLLSLAIELMNNQQIVIETLNHYHALTLTKTDVENKFENYLPDYKEDRQGKHYNNLLSAVYNTMLTGYMPDYTALLAPVFRSYEYYLHRILGDVMGLTTENNNGTNNFSFFDKIANGVYECNSPKRNLLDTNQLKYLNELYISYHEIRHPYSHWSADDTETAVITDMETAQDYIKKGLTLFDKYYILF